MPRSDRLYLNDIVQAAEAIERYITGRTRDDFLQDEIFARAALQRLAEIGEAAGRLGTDFRDRHPSIDWRRVTAFRNFAAHAYFAIDWEIVWIAATRNAPELRRQVTAIVARQDGLLDPPPSADR